LGLAAIEFSANGTLVDDATLPLLFALVCSSAFSVAIQTPTSVAAVLARAAFCSSFAALLLKSISGLAPLATVGDRAILNHLSSQTVVLAPLALTPTLLVLLLLALGRAVTTFRGTDMSQVHQRVN
jgi:hypothetical protein